MHVLKSHQEDDTGYCSLPRSAWYNETEERSSECTIGKFVADFLQGLLKNTKLLNEAAIMKDTCESLIIAS